MYVPWVATALIALKYPVPCVLWKNDVGKAQIGVDQWPEQNGTKAAKKEKRGMRTPCRSLLLLETRNGNNGNG